MKISRKDPPKPTPAEHTVAAMPVIGTPLRLARRGPRTKETNLFRGGSARRDGSMGLRMLAAGRYGLGSVIGRGATGMVYRAYDHVLNRPVAVKLFLAAPSGVVSRQHREVLTQAGLDHPALVSVYDVGEEHGQVFLVMQLVEGQTLAEQLIDAPLTVGETLRLGAVLGDAVAHMHAQGVIHRDIKPSNVLLDAAQRPFLTDFGVAAVLTDSAQLTEPGTVLGTAAYLAPEQVRGERLSPAVDVYALGLVLLECLTGRREYPGPAPEAAVARLHRRPEVPLQLPNSIVRLLTAMTDDDPARRPGADQLSRQLRTLTGDESPGLPAAVGPAPATHPGPFLPFPPQLPSTGTELDTGAEDSETGRVLDPVELPVAGPATSPGTGLLAAVPTGPDLTGPTPGEPSAAAPQAATAASARHRRRCLLAAAALLLALAIGIPVEIITSGAPDRATDTRSPRAQPAPGATSPGAAGLVDGASQAPGPGVSGVASPPTQAERQQLAASGTPVAVSRPRPAVPTMVQSPAPGPVLVPPALPQLQAPAAVSEPTRVPTRAAASRAQIEAGKAAARQFREDFAGNNASPDQGYGYYYYYGVGR